MNYINTVEDLFDTLDRYTEDVGNSDLAFRRRK